ncbi:MAG: RNA polymerase subunit sigma [Blastopirellula sp.]|nr:MAG: RNA polymerase subunit sigma [Blastopirellula sp.]
MTEFPETRNSLLVQVKDPLNREAWEQFAQIYRPVIYRLARQRGMQDADAQDLSQQVLMSVAAAITRWETSDETTRFRHWLRRVVKNAILNALSRKPQDLAVGGSSVRELLEEYPDADPETEQQIELEYRREIYLRAAEIVQTDVAADTWKAFEMTVIQALPIQEVATQLNKSIGTIYASRSRIMRRLRDEAERLENTES